MLLQVESELSSLIHETETESTGIIKLGTYTTASSVLSDVPEDQNLKIESIGEDELVFAVAKNRHRAQARHIQPRELAEFPFLSYPLRYELCYRKVEAKFGSHLNKCRIAIESESFDTIKQMLIRGVGATFIPRYLIADELKSGKVLALKVGQGQIPITFSLVTKKDTPLPLAVQKLRHVLLSSRNSRTHQ